MKNKLLILTAVFALASSALCTAQRKGFVIGGSVAYGVNQLATTFNYSLLAPYTNKDGQYYGFELNAGYMPIKASPAIVFSNLSVIMACF